MESRCIGRRRLRARNGGGRVLVGGMSCSMLKRRLFSTSLVYVRGSFCSLLIPQMPTPVCYQYHRQQVHGSTLWYLFHNSPRHCHAMLVSCNRPPQKTPVLSCPAWPSLQPDPFLPCNMFNTNARTPTLVCFQHRFICSKPLPVSLCPSYVSKILCKNDPLRRNL